MEQKKDPRVQVNLGAMEYIWNRVPKEKKGDIEYVVYVKTDLPYLYYSGLVDTQMYKMEQWLQAFEDCLGEDGRYWLTHEKMLSLGKFRYTKVVNEPFDPLKMRTGKYSVDRLWKVFERSIIPSTSLPEQFIKNIFDQMFREHKGLEDLIKKEDLENLPDYAKKALPEKSVAQLFEKEGDTEYVIVEQAYLLNLKRLLDLYPSPRRKLEMSVQDLRIEKLQKLSNIAQAPQKSSFESGQDFREVAKKSLKDILVKASENATAGRKPKDEVLDLKKLQKKPPTQF